MTTAELLQTFRDADWSDAEAFERLLAGLPPADTPQLLKLLDVLGNRWSGSEPQKQERRCLVFARLAEQVLDRDLFLPYVKALRIPDPHLRSTLSSLLPLVNNLRDHPELCELLRSDDADLRQRATLVLGRVGSRTVCERLTELVAEPGFPGRQEAMEVLRVLAGHRALEAYETVLSVGSAAEKLKALQHVASKGCLSKEPDRALRALTQVFLDRDEAVQQEAIGLFALNASEPEFFREVGPFLLDPNPRVARAAVRGLRHVRSPRALEALAQALRRGPNLVRLAAVEVLEQQGTPEALGPLVEALAHRQVAVRTRASEALGALCRAGRVELARTVLWLLRSRDVNVRRMALEVAHSVPDPEGRLWPQLIEYLYDEDWWVRERVVDTLVDVAGTQLLPHVVPHLDDADPLRRYFAVEVLRRLGASEAVGPLTRVASRDVDWLVRERAIQALGSLGEPSAAPVLVNILLQADDLRLACLEALAQLGSAESAQHVGLLLANEALDVETRRAALRCLASLGQPTHVSLIRRQVQHEDAEVRALAQELLHSWKQEGARTSGAAPHSLSLLDQLLIAMADFQADDLLISPGRQPCMKRVGKITPIAQNVFTEEQIRSFLLPRLSHLQAVDLDNHRDLDFSYEVAGRGLRFRVNVFHQLAGLSAVFRIVRGQIPDLKSLGLPPVVAELAQLKNGLVLLGGPTGSGKSTTLAALVDNINASRARHIITVEDPIETVHHRRLSLINQRELGTHTGDPLLALRSTLRQDPDVVLVGEMRDAATISFGITAAETGHLVFGTIHTLSAAATVDRLINACPFQQQDQVRAMLAGCLKAVVCQQLLDRRDAPGRCLAAEVMLNTDAVANLIRKGKTHQIVSVIATSRSLGMQSLDSDLLRLVQEGRITAEDAYVRAASKKEFEPLLGKSGPSAQRA